MDSFLTNVYTCILYVCRFDIGNEYLNILPRVFFCFAYEEDFNLHEVWIYEEIRIDRLESYHIYISISSTIMQTCDYQEDPVKKRDTKRFATRFHRTHILRLHPPEEKYIGNKKKASAYQQKSQKASVRGQDGVSVQ